MAKIAIVIGSFYSGPRLDLLVRGLRTLEFPDYSVLVHEQHGRDRKPRGFPAIFNGLVDHAFEDPTCEYAWILGDDVVPTRGCLESTQAVMEAAPTIGIIFPVEAWKTDPLTVPITMLPYSGAMASIHAAMNEGPVEVEMPFAGMACVCIRRQAWERVGYISTTLGLGYSEDFDWGIRCWNTGFRVVNYRRAWFLHERGATFNRLIAEGLCDAKMPYEAADRLKARWPDLKLWEQSGEDLMRQLKADYEKARHA